MASLVCVCGDVRGEEWKRELYKTLLVTMSAWTEPPESRETSHEGGVRGPSVV